MRDNLLFGLKIRPVAPATYDDASRLVREAFWKEAERAGNPALDPNADWIDYELAGATGPADLLPCMVDALKQVELDEDIYSLGLRGTIDVALRPDLAEKILKARHVLHGHLQDQSYAGLVETFSADHYNRNLSVAENLLFGTAVGKQFDGDNIAADPYVQSILTSTGLDLELQRMGLTIAETMVELFSGLSPDNPLFEQYSFISADELPNVRLLLQRLGGKGIEAVPDADRPRLMTLPFRYIEARHRLGLIDAAMEERLLAARRAFAAGLPPGLRNAVEFYDFGRYNSAATLQDNILFGRLVYGQAQAEERIGTLIAEVLDELGLRDSVVEVGLGVQCRRGRQAFAGDPASEARHRPCAHQAAPAPDRERGGRHVRRPHAGSRPRQHLGRGEERRTRRGVDRQPAGAGRTVRTGRGHAGRQGRRPGSASRPGGAWWALRRTDGVGLRQFRRMR